MTEPFEHKDNEFIAWYPSCVDAGEAGTVWEKAPAAYYVHIPFCSAICDYCGFAVERAKGAPIEEYLALLHTEIERYGATGRLANHRFVCGHFGGGTPSVLEASDLIAVNDLIRSTFDVAPDAELTVEVNPISFTMPKAEAYLAGGVNRISFGVQSFNDDTLKVIGRPHRAGDVVRTLEVIRTVGWDNYSLDVIYGVPGQTLAQLEDDLRHTVDSGAAHVSCFRLEIIPFTALKLREAAGMLPPRLSNGMLNEMDDLVTSVLCANGYREYGAFNFARPGYESVHNAIAFVAPQDEYVGFGNSSYSYMHDHVYCNYADLPRYRDAVADGRDPIALAHRLSALEAMSRYFVLGLKFFRVPRGPFVDRFGMEPETVFGAVLARLADADLVLRDGDDYVLTRTGRHYVNNVCKEFYVGESRGRRQHVQLVPTLTADQINNFARKAGLVPEERELTEHG